MEAMIRTFASKLARGKAAASCTHSKASLRLPTSLSSTGYGENERSGPAKNVLRFRISKVSWEIQARKLSRGGEAPVQVNRPARRRYCSPPDLSLRTGSEAGREKISPFAVVALGSDEPDPSPRRRRVRIPVEPLAPGVFEVEFSDIEGRILTTLAVPSSQIMTLHHGLIEVG